MTLDVFEDHIGDPVLVPHVGRQLSAGVKPAAALLAVEPTTDGGDQTDAVVETTVDGGVQW